MYINPVLNSRLLRMIMIGRVPSDVTQKAIRASLQLVALPIKGAVSVQDRGTWIQNAVRKLQDRPSGPAEQSDTERFIQNALTLADQRMETPKLQQSP